MKYQDKTREELINELLDLQHKYDEISLLYETEKSAFAALVEINSDPMLVKDCDRRIITANSAFVKASGYNSLAELVGKTSEEILNIPEYLEPAFSYKLDDLKALQLSEGQILQNEETIPMPNGKINTFLTTKFPIFVNQKIIGIGVIKSDITNRKQAEQFLAEEKERTEESEEKYRLLVDNINDLVCEIDENGVYTYVCSNYIGILGYTPQDLIGKNVMDLIHPEDLVLSLQKYEQIKDTFEKSFVIWRFKNKNGEYRTIESKGTVYTNSKNEKRTVVISRDITEQKLLENELKEKTSFLSTIMETSPVGIAAIDKTGSITYANKRAEQILGLVKTEITSLTYDAPVWKHTDINGAPMPAENLPFNIVKTTLSPVSNIQHGITWANGHRVLLSVNAEPIIDLHGNFNGIIATFEDITEQKSSEKQLEESERNLLTKNEELMLAKKNAEESEQRFKSLIENAPDGVVIINEQGNFMYASPNASRNFGYAEDEVLKHSGDDFTHPDDLPLILKTLEAIMLNPNLKPKVKYRFKRKNGEYRRIETTFTNLLSDKAINGIVLNFCDITEREQIFEELIIAKEKAEASEKKLLSVFSVAPTGIGLVKKRVIWEVNPMICELTGYTLEELIGKDSLILYPSQKEYDYVGVEKYRQIQDKGTGVLETKWKNKNGSIIEVLIASTPIDLDDLEKGIIFTVLDITERKRVEKELIHAKEKAEESERLKTAFLHNMSHEIRTPLNAISGFTGMLNKPDLQEDKRKSFVSIIQNSSNQLISIISDILTISSLETKQEKVNIDKVCINTIIVDLLAIFKQQAFNRNISLYSKQELNNKQSEIYTDKTKVTQILSNLISNALKFTHKGFIVFGYDLKEDFLEFYVKDTGIGINPELHEQIFERFRQADKSISKLYGGTGLGLAISKSFVELLGGKIWVHSELENGSTFYFTIPYKPVNEIHTTDNSVNSDIKPIVLVAEDQEFNFLYIEELLFDFNLTLIHAKDGKEAVEIFITNPDISLVFMDIKMPKMDGQTAAKIMKELKPDIPIIAQSAYALEYERAQYESYFDDYLTKPINEHDLRKIVLKYLINKEI